MAEIFLRILEMTVTASAIITGVFVFRVIFSKRTKSWVMGMLWALVLLRLCMPFTLESPVHLAQTAPGIQQSVQPERQPADGRNNTTINAVDYETGAVYEPQSAYEFTPETDTARESAATEQPAAFNIDWLAAAAYVWIAGAVAILLSAVWKGVSFGRSIKRCGEHEEAGRIAHGIRESLNIKKYVSVSICGKINAPVLFGYFRPQILLPGNCGSIDGDTLRCILTHELCHVKRHDILKGYIWLIAKAAHWFNPLVWLAYILFKDDIELGCDDMVLRHLGRDNRFAYTQSLIDVFRYYRRQLPLAVPLFESKPKLTERVIRMLKPSRRSNTAAVLSILLALIMLAAGFTTACSAAKAAEEPAETAQTETANNPEQTGNAEETAAFTYSAPQTWQCEARSDTTNVDINVNARVTVPTDKWGTYLSSPQQVTKEEVQKIINALTGGAVINEKKTLSSKEQLQENITRLESQKALFEKKLKDGDYAEEGSADESPVPSYGQNGPVLTKEVIQENIKIFADMLKEARQQLATAPDEETTVENELDLDNVFSELNAASKMGKEYQGTVNTGKSTPADIYIYVSPNSFSLNFRDYDDYEKSFSLGEAYTGQQLFKCDISVDDAKAIAREKVAEMGFDGLDVDTVQTCEMLDRKRAEGDKLPECFIFIFKTKLDGATAAYAQGSGISFTGEAETKHAPQSEVAVYVDDSGVIGVEITEVKAQINRRSYGIKLMDFDKIMDIFKEQIFIRNPYYSGKVNDDNVTGREVHINNIRLGYMPVYSGSGDEIIFIPVWDFFGEELTTYKEGVGGDLGDALDENNQLRTDLGIQSVLTISAIDGSIIDR